MGNGTPFTLDKESRLKRGLNPGPLDQQARAQSTEVRMPLLGVSLGRSLTYYALIFRIFLSHFVSVVEIDFFYAIQ